MPALLSEVFKETSFIVDNGQIKAHYGKPAAAKDTTTTMDTNDAAKPEKEQWEERIVTLIKQNNQLQEQIKAMQQKMETLTQQGGARFDIVAFAEQNPIITVIIILVGIDLFRKAFLK